MKSEATESTARRRLVRRLVSATLALGSGGVLGVAAWLDPAPQGHSTHLQLGLGRCTIYSLSGWPCPMCGMTTSFALFADLHPVTAFLNQPFSSVLFLLTVLTFGIAVAEVVDARGRWEAISRVIAPYEGRLAALFVAGMVGGWLWKIAMLRPVN